VFYNPVMMSNRNITIALMAAATKLYEMKKWRIADPMAATGVRGIRMLLELKNIESVSMNDYSSAAASLIKKNLLLNSIRGKASVTANEANKFLLNNRPFNYIDIDPFGYPGMFLDAAVKRVWHNGILAVTATDTSALAGTSPAACRRKYLATPLRNGFMHETGVRILIRLAQMIGAMHEKALTPVFSYYKEHYIRAFLLCRTGAGRADEILRQHAEILYCGNCSGRRIMKVDDNNKCGVCGNAMARAGPLWAGKLFDAQLAGRIATTAAKNRNIDEGTRQFLRTIAEEARHEEKCGVGFYSIEDLCEKHRIAQQPATSALVSRLKKAGYAAAPTHCSTTGVRTNAQVNAVVAAAGGKSLYGRKRQVGE